MKQLFWLLAALLLALISLASYKLAVYLPWFGVFPALLIADSLLLAISCLVASFFWRHTRGAFAMLLVSWFCLALNVELIGALPWNIGAMDSAPAVTIRHRIDTQSLRTISLTGDATPLIAAMGRSSDAIAQFTPVGTLGDIHLSTDFPTTADIGDMLWRRGLTPIIGGSSYPALHIERIERRDRFVLKVTVLASAKDVAGTYRRTLWYPARAPGSVRYEPGSQYGAAVYASFSCNLWRVLTAYCIDKGRSLHDDLDEFIVATMGRSVPSGRESAIGILRPTDIEGESVITTYARGGAGDHLREIDDRQSLRYPSSTEDRSVCNPDVALIRVGMGGGVGVLAVMKDSDDPANLPKRWPWLPEAKRMIEAGLGGQVYCDDKHRQFVTFSVLNNVGVPNLRIHVFDAEWRLSGAYYLRLPDAEQPWPLRIEPDSFSVSDSGDIRFATAFLKAPEGDGDSRRDYVVRAYYSSGS